MENKITKMKDFFDERLAQCSRRNQELIADGCGDEANFAKVKGNIYDIFRTVFSVAIKTCGEDENEIRSFFMTRIQQIPSGWETALEKARAHQDMERACLEQIKLDAARDIRENFERIWGERK